MSENNTGALFITAARNSLAEGLRKVEHCVHQLNEEQVWWRPAPQMNSVANLMLHLAGNVRQWILSGVGGARDIRNRPEEFVDRSDSSALWQGLDQPTHLGVVGRDHQDVINGERP